MKLLAFTDTHTDEEMLAELDVKAKDADLLLCTGDIAWFGHGAEESVEIFESWGKPCLVIHGNHEGEEELEELCSDKKNVEFIHKKIVIKEDIMIIGFGGDWFNPISEEFEAWTEEIQREVEEKKPKKMVLMVHMPVANTKTDYIYSAHRGNHSYRKFIEHFQPDLVLFGHFHQTFHIKDVIGESLLCNPGPDGEFFEL